MWCARCSSWRATTAGSFLLFRVPSSLASASCGRVALWVRTTPFDAGSAERSPLLNRLSRGPDPSRVTLVGPTDAIRGRLGGEAPSPLPPCPRSGPFVSHSGRFSRLLSRRSGDFAQREPLTGQIPEPEKRDGNELTHVVVQREGEGPALVDPEEREPPHAGHLHGAHVTRCRCHDDAERGRDQEHDRRVPRHGEREG